METISVFIKEIYLYKTDWKMHKSNKFPINDLTSF